MLLCSPKLNKESSIGRLQTLKLQCSSATGDSGQSYWLYSTALTVFDKLCRRHRGGEINQAVAKLESLIREIASSADGLSSADAGKTSGNGFGALKAPLVKARPSRLTTLRQVETRRSPRTE
jgi:hypothetical protein